MPRLTLALPLALALALPLPAHAKVGSIELSELAQRSTVIAIVKVTAVGKRSARARVLTPVKGVAAGATVTFDPERRWVCDTSAARRGETVLLFLEPAPKGGRVPRIAHHGRGRMFLVDDGGITRVQPNAGDVVWPATLAVDAAGRPALADLLPLLAPAGP